MAEIMKVLSTFSDDREVGEPPTTVECKKGWIITLNENGNYTPFFVNVREEDLVWKTDKNNEIFSRIQKTLDNKNVKYSSSFITPEPYLNIEVDDWQYEIKSDKTFTASYINIPNKENWKTQMVTINDTNYLIGIEVSIKLPIPILKEKCLFIPSINPNLTSIVPSFTLNSSTNPNAYDEIILKISDSSISQNGNELEKMCDEKYQTNISILLKGKIY